MNMTEKNGQPSMEEILASIRRIIAEEPASHPHNGELRGTPIMLKGDGPKGDGALDDAGEFDLPAIFRSSPPPAAERQTPLLGRLTDAIRHATTAQPEPSAAAASAEPYPVAEAVEAVAAGAGEAGSSGLSSLKPIRPEGPAIVEPIRPFNGAAPGRDPASATSQSSAFPAKASGAKEEPKRVMAPFKDTHFLKMASPVAAPAGQPTPAAPAPVVSSPPPAVETTPPDFSSIIPAQIDRSSLMSPTPQPTQAAAPMPPAQTAPIAMPPPPPLPMAAPVPPQQSVVVAPPSGVEGTGTIEDTTADLLRPMLRQWLADNMPRMVEKALHIEIAESIKAPRKP